MNQAYVTRRVYSTGQAVVARAIAPTLVGGTVAFTNSGRMSNAATCFATTALMRHMAKFMPGHAWKPWPNVLTM